MPVGAKEKAMSKLVLKSLVFENVDGRQIKLSEAEARELHKELELLFADKTPIMFPAAPIIIQQEPVYPVITWTGPTTGRWNNDNGWLAMCQCEEV